MKIDTEKMVGERGVEAKNAPRCTGSDDLKCIGDVQRYHVHCIKSGHDWGLFWYCDAHAAEDRRRGFTVERAAKEMSHEAVCEQ